MSGAAGSAKKLRDGDKRGASDAQYALETGMKAEFTKAAQDLSSNTQLSFTAVAKKAKEQAKLFLQNATDYGPALGSSSGDAPATVEKLRRAFKGSHASMLSICCSVRQGMEVHAHLKDVGSKPLSLQGKALGDLLIFKRMSTASKEVVKDAEDSMPYFKELKKLMGERKAGEEEDEVGLAEPKDLKTRITCPVSMAIMKEPVKNPACGHTFDKAALLGLFVGGKQAMNCPHKGCKVQCVKANLVDDEDVVQQVRMYERMQESSLEEAERGAGGRGAGGGGGGGGKRRKDAMEEEG